MTKENILYFFKSKQEAIDFVSLKISTLSTELQTIDDAMHYDIFAENFNKTSTNNKQLYELKNKFIEDAKRILRIQIVHYANKKEDIESVNMED